MPIAHPYHAIFIHIPKAGGTSMEGALGIWTYDNTVEEHPLKLFGRQFQHRTAQQLRDVFVNPRVFEGYYKFGFVRNPWDRLVSEYFYLKERKVIDFPFEHFASEAFLTRQDLPGFIVDHLRPQSDYVFDQSGENLLDFVGRFERIAEDWAQVARRLGLPKESLPHHNRKQSSGRGYQDMYDVQTQASVARYYARDIEAFGYQF